MLSLDFTTQQYFILTNSGWPITLPQLPFEAGSGPSYEPAPNVLRTDMEAGPAKVRRRFTAVPERVTFSLTLSEAELAILDSFVRITLRDALPFDWIDHRNGANATYTFMVRPSSEWYGGDYWAVNFQLEKQP